MLCLCGLADSNQEFSLILGNTSSDVERIAKVGMAPLIERTGKTYSRLYADQGSSP